MIEVMAALPPTRLRLAADLSATDGLIVVDMQNDFVTGSLAVKNAELILPAVNDAIRLFRKKWFSMCWHPADHCSFQAQGGRWVPHCVHGTRGAELVAGMDWGGSPKIYKGIRRDADAYSAFDGTDLEDQLRAERISRVFVCGLATDYCVKATVLDALAAGFTTLVLADAIAAVNVEREDGALALKTMSDAGARVVRGSI